MFHEGDHDDTTTGRIRRPRIGAALMAARRRRVPEGQLEFDLWGMGETTADARLSLTRALTIDPRDNDPTEAAEEEQREQVRPSGDAPLADLLPDPVGSTENPTGFFAELGREVDAQVSDLAAILVRSRSSAQTYLQEVARQATARRIAEEVVMAQLVWAGDPELRLEQAREEWEQTRPSDENLVTWAERMQDAPDLMPSTVELEQMALDWAVPVEFLEGLVATEPPREYLRANKAVLQEAATIRFLRELR